VLVVFCLVVASIDYARWYAEYSDWALYGRRRWRWEYAQHAGVLVGLAIICYCLGQLLSLWIRSAILRMTLAVLYAVPLVSWAAIIVTVEVPLWWSVLPIPIVLLIASRMTVRDWMVERKGPPLRWKRALILGIPGAAIAAGVIAYRWTEIPNVEPQFTSPRTSPSELAAAKAKGREYLRAMQSYEPWADEIPRDPEVDDRTSQDVLDPAEYALDSLTDEQDQWLEQHQALIEQILAVTPGEYVWPTSEEYAGQLTSGGNMPVLPPQWDAVDWPRAVLYSRANALPEILLKSALRCQRNGDLDGALERYDATLGYVCAGRNYPSVMWIYRIAMHRLRYWAAKPGQTPERIRRAMKVVQQSAKGTMLPYLEPSLEEFYLTAKAGLLDDEYGGEAWYWRAPVADQPIMKWVYRLMPWERQRALRLHKANVAWSLARLQQVRAALERNRPLPRPERYEELNRWSRTTWSPIGFFAEDLGFSQASLASECIVVQRATSIVLALEGWRLENGNLPKSLDELSPSWLDQLPVEPWSARPFRYHPQGVVESVEWSDSVVHLRQFELPRHVPFIEADAVSYGSGGSVMTDRRIFPIP